MTTRTPPTALDPILADTDAASRLDGLTAYLTRLDAQAARARTARTATVTELRAADPKVNTWRALAARTGLSEQHLRALVATADLIREDHKDVGAKPNSTTA